MNFNFNKVKAYFSSKFHGYRKSRSRNDRVRWQSVTQEPFEEVERNSTVASFPADDLHEVDEYVENACDDEDEPGTLGIIHYEMEVATTNGVVTESNVEDRSTSLSIFSDLDDWTSPNASRTVDGSQTNLGYTDTESDASSQSSGWIYEKAIIHSGDNGIDFTRSHNRMSMFEFDRHRKLPKFLRLSDNRISLNERRQSSNKSDPRLNNQRSVPLHAAYDTSSCIDTRAVSQISLPRRPLSVQQTSFVGPDSSSPRISNQSSDNANSDDIDWSWLDDAMKEMRSEIELAHSVRQRPYQADAECQTTDHISCAEVERRRSCEVAELHVNSTGPTDHSSPYRTIAASCSSSDSCNNCGSGSSSGNADMPSNKTPAEDESADGGGPSRSSVIGVHNNNPLESHQRPVSTWLRQSMRRLIHFNLGDPTLPDAQAASADAQSTRPVSAPAVVISAPIVNTPPPSTTSEPVENTGYISDSTDRQVLPGSRPESGISTAADCEGRSPLGPWPHTLSSLFAFLSCTIGLFNISRFAVLSVHYGGNFIVQFVLLSVILGIPLLTFHAALGQMLGSGPVDMWKISPVFQGIGIALLISQALIGVYSVVGVSWMFVYFRDSFITKQDTYRWGEPFKLYREDAGEIPGQFFNTTLGRLDETVPDYLSGVVLQRHSLASPHSAFGNLKFQLTFNLAVIWMIVFVSLSKGLRSYGKVIYVFSVVPVIGVFVISTKLLGLTPIRHGLFPHTNWPDFFLNTRSWISAATEVMLTWNLLGASVMQVTSHNKASKRLWRDILTTVLITFFVLILSAFLANTCHQLLTLKYSYIPSSFEGMNSYTFLRPMGASLPPNYATPLRDMPHASLVAGDRVGRPGAIQESGYQVLRLATELMPAMFAFLGADFLSPFWAVLFYFTLILFGIAQQLAIWHCVITGILAINTAALKSWETTITFFTCATGFVLGLPMTTELGVFVVYFLDYCVGGGWWILVVTLVQLCAVLMIRGRPYTGDAIASTLFGSPPQSSSSSSTSSNFAQVLTPILTFTWNVTLPVALLIIAIAIFKTGGYRDMWVWRTTSRTYWPLWAREVSVLIQLTPMLCIPVVAIIQSYRYLSTGPPDILDRLTTLYRPHGTDSSCRPNSATSGTRLNTTEGGENSSTTTNQPPTEDPPPKYTPPPSYSTATGARIAKLLRQSFRRSVRRLQIALEGGEQPSTTNATSVGATSGRPPPPDYQSVLVEMTQPSHIQRNHQITAQEVVQTLGGHVQRSTTPSSSTTLQSFPSPSTTTSSLRTP